MKRTVQISQNQERKKKKEECESGAFSSREGRDSSRADEVRRSKIRHEGNLMPGPPLFCKRVAAARECLGEEGT